MVPAATAMSPPPAPYATGVAGGDGAVTGRLPLLPNPAPARAQASPLRSANDAVAPAVVDSVLITSCVKRFSPASKVAFGGQPSVSPLQAVDTLGLVIRSWMPFGSAELLPCERTTLPLPSDPAPPRVQGSGAGSSLITGL